jgi:hypothetical protein
LALGKGPITVPRAVTALLFAECWFRLLAKALPSARVKALGKDAFADGFFADGSLPSVALGKGFAERFCGFAECLGHSAKGAPPVVLPIFSEISLPF